jgi:hypothetical protein
LSAAEEGREERAEVAVDDLERGRESASALGVELCEALAKSRHGAGKIGSLGSHGLKAAREFRDLFVGVKIDGAKRVTLALQGRRAAHQ